MSTIGDKSGYTLQNCGNELCLSIQTRRHLTPTAMAMYWWAGFPDHALAEARVYKARHRDIRFIVGEIKKSVSILGYTITSLPFTDSEAEDIVTISEIFRDRFKMGRGQ